MQVNKSKQGYKVIPMTLTQIADIGGVGICDRCGQASFKFQYVGVLNHAFCQPCYDDWESYATYYPEDISIESRNIDRMLNRLKN